MLSLLVIFEVLVRNCVFRIVVVFVSSVKGIVLAGGSGTRLHPVTQVISKQLLPIYDKPMVYYPLSVLMLADIRHIMIISTPRDIDHFKMLFRDGRDFGLHLEYAVQDQPRGLAESFLIAESFLGGENVCLILGDNIFYGGGFSGVLRETVKDFRGAVIFSHRVKDPQRFGVVEVDDRGQVLSIEEKPKKPKSNDAVTGLYFYDHTVVSKAASMTPSDRGELEITDLNRLYLEEKNLDCIKLPRGMTWLDTGTFDSLVESAIFVKTIQERQGTVVACLEEIALMKDWITSEDLFSSLRGAPKTHYTKYLMNLVGRSSGKTQ